MEVGLIARATTIIIIIITIIIIIIINYGRNVMSINDKYNETI